MALWQALRAGRVSQASLGYHVRHGPGVSLHYSMATAASASPDSSRSSCLSREKLTLQQLNRRLASYLHQVQCLEATNQRLEHQILEVLDRKCPRENKELVEHLRTASALQDQISECLSAQAHMKLQLLTAELRVFNFSVRCEKERLRREFLETELSNLRLLEKELKLHKLPELQRMLGHQTQQLMEMQIQHQQDIQGQQAQLLGGISLEMQTDESSDLIKELDEQRQMSVTVLDRNQNKCWFNTQVFMLNSSEAFDSSVRSAVIQAELEELRRTAAGLEEELSWLQALNVLLEASSLEQTESCVLQLGDLQQREDSLRRELDSMLQAAAHCTADHQTLLNITSQLDTEIQNYRRLLNELSQEGPAARRRQAPLDRTISVQRGNLRMMEVLSDVSNNNQNKLMEAKKIPFGTAFSSPDSYSNLERTTASRKKIELIVNSDKIVYSSHETKEMSMALSVPSLINLAGQEALMCTTESKKSTSLTDSGVALSSSDPEELLSPTESDVFLSPTKTVVCSSPEICPGIVETEMLTDHVFCPLDLEDNFSCPVLLPSDPEMYLSPNNATKCLGSVETKGSLSEEEHRAASLYLNEAKAQMRPVAKYIFSTKEEGQSLSFSDDQKNRKVTISVRDGDSLCFGSFECNGAKSKSLEDLIVADKKEKFDSEGLYGIVSDARTPRDRYKNTSSVRSPEGRYDSGDQKESANMGSGINRISASTSESNSSVAMHLATNFSGSIVNLSTIVSNDAESASTDGVQRRFSHENGEWMGYGGILARKSNLDRGTSLNSEETNESPLLGKLPATSPPETRRYGRRWSGEWMVYRNGLGNKRSPDGSGQSLVVATHPDRNIPPETGISGKREKGEVFNGVSLQCKHGVDSGFSLPRAGSEESMAMNMVHATHQPPYPGVGRLDRGESREWILRATHLATSPPETRRYCNRGNDKLMVGGSSESLPKTESKECLPVTTNIASSPPESERFGSTGGGERIVYGGHTGCMSGLANTDSKESTSKAWLSTRPPVVGRVDDGGSVKWRVYRGSTGRLSSAGEADKVIASTSEGQMISPANSYTRRGPRLSSAGRLSSSSVVRRSRSVGSGGSSGSGVRLSSSPSSHRIRSSGKLASTGSGEWKPIYRSVSDHRSSAGSARSSSAGRMTSIRTATSPPGAFNTGSSGRFSSSENGEIRISSAGNVSKHSSSGSNNRIRSPNNGEFSCSDRSGRTSSTGGRIINSSKPRIRSSSSRAGGNNEKISVCKMVALSISAAGRERSQERLRSAQQPQQQQAAVTSPLIHRRLTIGVVVTSANPDGFDRQTKED